MVAEASLVAGIGIDRSIEEISADPRPDGLELLVGCRGGGHLRAALAEFVPDELAAGTPLYLLLDDISGASLVSGFAWSQWPEMWDQLRASRLQVRDMEGVCIGFAPGGSALEEQRSGHPISRVRVVGPLVAPGDPHGWHELAELNGVSYRRARRIDVWRDPVDGTVIIDSGFQDSAGNPEHGRIAVHEYVVRATADPDTLALATVTPDPRILPFRTCTDAVATASDVIGTPLAELRTTVLDRLARAAGCTHLNDMLRAFAEVPVLLAQLDRELAR